MLDISFNDSVNRVYLKRIIFPFGESIFSVKYLYDPYLICFITLIASIAEPKSQEEFFSNLNKRSQVLSFAYTNRLVFFGVQVWQTVGQNK